MQFALLGSVLTSKVVRYAILALALIAALWWLHGSIKESGRVEGRAEVTAKLQPKIDQLEKDLTHEKSVTAAYRQTVQNQQEAHAKAVASLKEDSKATLQEVSDKLDQSEARRKQLEKLYAKITTRVTPKADAACTVPRGFVSLHNDAANPAHPTGTAQAATVPGSGQADVDAPSGVALSAVAHTVTENYAQYHDLAAQLEAWQTWYKGAYANWQKAVQLQQGYVTVLPPTVH